KAAEDSKVVDIKKLRAASTNKPAKVEPSPFMVRYSTSAAHTTNNTTTAQTIRTSEDERLKKITERIAKKTVESKNGRRKAFEIPASVERERSSSSCFSGRK
ncbi:hypothetical protein PENTCL1PPCAC_20515, partial [Pristionchus entomophagus]